MIKEYRIDTKVRNNLILSRMEKMGFNSVLSFCTKNKISTRLFSIINLKLSPIQPDGKWRNFILKTAEILECGPEDLFSDIQLNTAIKTNKHTIMVNEAEMKFMLENNNNLSLEDIVDNDRRNIKLLEALKTLPKRDEELLRMRFGIDDGNIKTLAECGEILGVSGNRIRQIEARALRRLRDPSRSSSLKEFIKQE